MHATNINTRYVRLVDCSPADYLRRIGVCIAGVPASGTAKLSLILPVALVDVAALGARARSVTGIDKLDRDPGSFSLIGNKALKLAEGPGMQTVPLRFSSPYANANPAQVFKRDTASGAFRSGNNFFGNLMVNGTGEPSFARAPFAQQTFGRASAFLLKFAAKPVVPVAQPVEMPSGKACSVGGVCNRSDAEIHADPVMYCAFLNIRQIDGSEQEPEPFTVDEIGLTFLESKQPGLVLTADEWYGEPPIDAPNADKLSGHIPGKDTPVEGDRTKRTKNTLPPPVQCVSIGHFCDEPYNGLSRKREFFPELAIKKSLQPELFKLPGIPGQLAQIVSSGVRQAQGTQQRIGLFWRRLQLELKSQFHCW